MPTPKQIADAWATIRAARDTKRQTERKEKFDLAEWTAENHGLRYAIGQKWDIANAERLTTQRLAWSKQSAAWQAIWTQDAARIAELKNTIRMERHPALNERHDDLCALDELLRLQRQDYVRTELKRSLAQSRLDQAAD